MLIPPLSDLNGRMSVPELKPEICIPAPHFKTQLLVYQFFNKNLHVYIFLLKEIHAVTINYKASPGYFPRISFDFN